MPCKIRRGRGLSSSGLGWSERVLESWATAPRSHKRASVRGGGSQHDWLFVQGALHARDANPGVSREFQQWEHVRLHGNQKSRDGMGSRASQFNGSVMALGTQVFKILALPAPSHLPSQMSYWHGRMMAAIGKGRKSKTSCPSVSDILNGDSEFFKRVKVEGGGIYIFLFRIFLSPSSAPC